MAEFENATPNIIAENLHVKYRTAISGKRGEKKTARATISTMFRRDSTTVRALRGVNLVAHEGEMIGIVGANGSGKSTFLRNLAGVEQPDRGRVLVRYQPLLLGVSAALQPTLSGSENVRLGCLAMGLTPAESDAAYEHVVELSALGPAIHRPMGTYSSGMGARLRFAIALAARPRVLLIDEALSTGDATFADRSESAMAELLEDAGTVLLVNHAAKTIQELCNRAVWMHRGEILMDGPAVEVAERYRWWAWNVAKGEHEVSDKLLKDVMSSAVTDGIHILEPELTESYVPRHAVRGGRKKTQLTANIEAADHVDKTVDELDTHTEEDLPDALLVQPGYGKYAAHEYPSEAETRGRSLFEQPKSSPHPPLRPSDRKVVLRAADPKDRASTVAASSDLTEKRLSSRTTNSSTNRTAGNHIAQNTDTKSGAKS